MEMLLKIPHLRKEGMCPVNGIRDLVQWRAGQEWSNEFVWGLGQGCGFAYLRYNAATPPRQVYTGIATPRQHRYFADIFRVSFVEFENRAFKFSWGKAQEAVAAGTPPVLGPMDMFHLHYYKDLFHKRHIPIHFVLLVGSNDNTAFVHDTGEDAIQAIPLEELKLAWDVNVPGLGKRNRLAILDIPSSLPPTDELIRKSIADECQTMLNPPISMLGIPAMKKTAREITHWTEELGDEAATSCLSQVREYLNSPPDIEGGHLTGGRDLYISFLQEAGEVTGLDFSAAIKWLRESMAVIPKISEAIRQCDYKKTGDYFEQMAWAELKAFTELSMVVG